MGRRSRSSILYDGCFAHVFSRATERRRIFRGDEDFEVFNGLLLKSKAQASYRIHHYCLMHTHFHLVVSMDNIRQFSNGLKWVKWHYTRYFNFTMQRFGPLWRDRFKSLVIENERYLQACGQYVERNPVEAGMVQRAEDWPHSSSGYYLCGKLDALVDGYRFDGEPVQIDENSKAFFTKGPAIGSDLFRIYCQEQPSAAMFVPS